MLELRDRWVWDLWHVLDGDVHHLFFLCAPRSLGDPDLRHWNVTVGHATSLDLTDWTVHEDAFGPGPTGAFDDCTTWTGSIVRHGGRWAMLYTATSRAEDGRVQRVGLAWSDDLWTWERHPGPVMEAAGPHYERLGSGEWFDEAWRDPWVFELDGWWHCLLTARAADGDPPGRGVIGHARSRDLVDWELLPAVTEPFGLGQLEVPQLTNLGGRWQLVFCSDRATQTSAAAARLPGTGTYHLTADGPLGPFVGTPMAIEAGDPACSYAGRVVEDAAARVWFLAWERADEDGRFVGRILDPAPVEVGAGGRLVLGVR